MNLISTDNLDPEDLTQLMHSAASTAVDMFENSNFIKYIENYGIKFEEEQSFGPLVVMFVILCSMVSAGFTSTFIMHKPVTKITQDADSAIDAKESTDGLGRDYLDNFSALPKSRHVIIILLSCLGITIMLVMIGLPMYTLFIVYYFTRELLPYYEHNDLLKSSMLVDAIYGGIIIWGTVKYLSGLYNIFRRPSAKTPVNSWCSLNIFGQFVSIPVPVMAFSALFNLVALAISPNPANDFIFYPVVLTAYIWGLFQAALSSKKSKPFRYNLFCAYLYMIFIAIYIAFMKEYSSINSEFDIEYDNADILKRVILWSIFIYGLYGSAGIPTFIYWSICLDIARGKIANDAVENVSLISTETSDHDTVDKQAMPVSQETIPEPAYLTILSNPVIYGVYTKVAFAICAFANLYIYFYLKTHGIYLNSIQFTAISSIISRFLMVNGIFVLALVRRELRLVLNFEVEPIIEEPKSATITRRKAKGDVEDQAIAVASFTDEPKEAEK